MNIGVFKWLFILLIISLLSSLFVYFKFRGNLLIIYNYETNTSSNSTYIHPMFTDPEAKRCYALKSLTMPEEIMDLDAVAPGRHRLNKSVAPTEVTFNKVHSILYGDPTTKSIYRFGRKYFNKSFDRSYPHTYLTANVFNSIIKTLDPSLKLQFVVEVGSFTGNSAAIMGRILKNAYPGSFLLCIDTWLGDLNMWINKVVWKHLSVTEDGRPTVYYQFLTNTIAENLTNIILPVSMSSIIGARFLRTFQFHPQIIYLDSAHEQGETLIELALYWNILQPGGVLFGDDWGWASVRCDVKKFMYIRKLTVEHAGNTWFLKKPLN